MPEIDIAISKENKGAGAAARSSAAPKKEKAKKNSYAFESFLATLALFVVLVGAYESLTEMSFPAFSLLSLVHSAGYLKNYPIIYEPSKGIWHPLGWTGSAMMAVMMLYSVRKRVSALGRLGSMRHWLSAHMFFGVMGPLLVTLHTTFKFNGLVATSFWCMIVTMVFGILGRYIYVQIPRSITGAELGVKEIENSVEELNREIGSQLRKTNISNLLSELGVKDAEKFVREADREHGKHNIKDNHISSLLESISTVDVRERGAVSALFYMMWTDIKNYFKILALKREIKRRYKLGRAASVEVIRLLNKKASLLRRKSLLVTSHKLLHHWHVLHVPLAIVMFIIMFIHIIVYYIFRAAV